MVKRICNQLRNAAKNGLFHIFGSGVLAQVLGLVSAVVVVRALPKADYGYYTLANNLYSYLAIFFGLGMGSAALQFCSEQVSDGRKNAVYTFALTRGSGFNLFLAAVILLLAGFKRATGDGETARYLSMMCGLPMVVYLNNFFQIVLRVHCENILYSRVNMAFSVAVVIGNILFTFLFGVPGLILATYTANLLAAGLGAFFLQKREFFSSLKRRERLEWENKYEITKYALLCAVTNFASTMLVLLDVTCLDIVLEDPTVLADYKVASTIPSACLMIPSALITYFYPKIVWNYSADAPNFPGYIRRMLGLFTAVNFVVFLGLMVMAPVIIWLIYGEKYMNVLPIFRVLSLNFLIYGSVRLLLGNVIAAMKKSEVNLAIAVASGILNILLNLTLIPRLGSVGAAIATVCVSISVSLMNCLFLRRQWRKIRNRDLGSSDTNSG